MPNHVPLLLHYTGEGSLLNTVIGNGKRFIAYEIIKKLKEKGEETLLKTLKEGVQSKDREKGQLHVVWKDSFEVKQYRTNAFLLQKLHYLHNNPVGGKWMLAPSPLNTCIPPHDFIIVESNNSLRLWIMKNCTSYGFPHTLVLNGIFFRRETRRERKSYERN
jgi:hypothetical protein